MWQIAGTATETVFDGGLHRAQVAGAEAAFYQQVATYRQTVLAALQQVEDQLSNLRSNSAYRMKRLRFRAGRSRSP